MSGKFSSVLGGLRRAGSAARRAGSAAGRRVGSAARKVAARAGNAAKNASNESPFKVTDLKGIGDKYGANFNSAMQQQGIDHTDEQAVRKHLESNWDSARFHDNDSHNSRIRNSLSSHFFNREPGAAHEKKAKKYEGQATKENQAATATAVIPEAGPLISMGMKKKAGDAERKAEKERKKAAKEQNKAARQQRRASRTQQRGGLGNAILGGAVGGAIGGVAGEAVKGVANSVKNRGFILFLAGWTMFIIVNIIGIPDFYYTVSLLLLIYASVIVFNKKGMVFVISFIVWYLFYKAPIGNNSQYPLFFVVLLAIVLHGIINRASKKEKFVDTVKEDLLYGGGAIFIFLIDIGAVEILIDLGLPVPEQITLFMFYLPLWAYVGFFVMISENEELAKRKTWFTKTLGFLSILYLVLIFMFFGFSSNAYGEDSFLPGPEELLQAKRDAYDQLPKTENPAKSQIICLLNEPTDVQECVNRRQENSRIMALCEQSELVQSGIQTTDECMAEERQRVEDEKTKVSGAEDRTITEKTEAKIEVNDYFPMTTYRRVGDETKTSYITNLKMENPRFEENNQIEVEFSCYFKKSREENVSGIVTPERIRVTSRSPSNAVVCTPNEQLNGTYTMVQEASIRNLVTSSRLSKIIVGSKTDQWMDERADQLIDAHCGGGECVSLAPNEFAALNFMVGSFDNPIIRAGETIFLAATIEKKDSSGELIRVNSFEIDLGELNAYVDNPACLSGQNLVVDGGDTLHLPTCVISELPYPDLGDGYIFKEYRGKVNYDFKLKKEIRNVKVEVIS